MSDIKPWWEYLNTVDYFSYRWAETGLAMRALRSFEKVGHFEKRDTLLPEDDIDDLAVRFELAFPEFKNFWRGNSRCYSCPDAFVEIRVDSEKDATIRVLATETRYEELKLFVNNNTTQTKQKGTVYTLTSSPDGFNFMGVGVAGKTIERGNYDPKVLEGYDKIVADLGAKEPHGRLSILEGVAGSGKTHLVRGILNDVAGPTFVIVQPAIMAQLANPALMPTLIDFHRERKNGSMVFIVEDADEILAKRMSDNMSAVSAALNLSDGILGNLLDIRILATTNAVHEDVDPAFKRPGRLSALVHVGALSPEQACQVYERLTGKPALVYGLDSDPLQGRPMFTTNTTLASVYEAAKTGSTAPKKDRKFGF